MKEVERRKEGDIIAGVSLHDVNGEVRMVRKMGFAEREDKHCDAGDHHEGLNHGEEERNGAIRRRGSGLCRPRKFRSGHDW
eukprot:768432-Hanusia_phi.AAC.5